MKPTLKIITLFAFLSTLANCKGQDETDRIQNDVPANKTRPVGGGCDGCELMYVDMPETIQTTDTSAGWDETGQKLLIQGTVYKKGGKVPATDVIIYYWQTDNDGYYSPKKGMGEGAKRHGHIRGWVKTDVSGNYSIFTIRPAPYPNEDMPAHIHTSIKEPNIADEYYIDEFVFDDDPLLTRKKTEARENRGGSGILHITTVDELQVANHNIFLGLHIPNYPD